MALTQISTQGIKDGTITGSDLATNIDLVDNQKIRFGAGDDLAIFHDGTDNLLSTSGTVLAVHRATTNASNPVFEVRSNHGATNQIKFQVDGDGDVLIPTDTGKLQLGASQDLQIYHDGSHSYVKNTTGHLKIGDANVHIMNAACDEDMIHAVQNDRVELYYDNSKKFETQNLGVTVTGGVYPAAADTYQLGGSSLRWNELNIKSVIDVSDNGKIRMGDSDDLQIYHDGSDSFINDAGTGSLIIKSSQIIIREADDGAMAYFKNEGAVELNFNNSKKFETRSGGAAVFGHLELGDNDKVMLGDSNDLQIFHNATHSFLENSTNGLYARSDEILLQSYTGNENYIIATLNGAVELYHNNVKQMETTSGGASIRNHHKFDTGTVTQRSYLSSGNGINHRIMLAGAGTSNVQGQYIRAFANCANIDDSGTVKFVIFATGDCQNANNSFAGFSDVNLKQDITDASSQWDDIKNLKVRKYRFKNNPTGPLQIGCIAQEAETVSPGLIDTDPEEGFKSLKYSVLYMKGIKCLQEAMARIEALETEVAALKAA